MLSNGVNVIERGWAGHFICADRCRFRRNTLLIYKDRKWVVSTVGAMVIDRKYVSIGCDRWYETMAFWSEGDEYDDADVSREILFCSQWGLFASSWEELIAKHSKPDLEANKMHDCVVKELIEKIRSE